MTTKRDKQDEPTAAKGLTVKKETLKDLNPKDGEKVKGGALPGRRTAKCAA